MTNNISWYDNYIIDNIRNITPLKTDIFKIITTFGDWAIMILIIVLILIFVKDKRYSIYIAINLGLSAGINTILKHIFQRERPLDMLVNETTYSYPSGHSFVSMAFYGLLIYLITKSSINNKLKYILNSLIVVLLVLIGTSRIYLGVHFPSDVLGGFLAGAIYLIIIIEIMIRIKENKNEKKK